MTPHRIITLTTDFGLSDGYVAAMKGVILGIAPDASLVDVSHLVAPQNVRGGSYLLESVYRYFSPDAVHLAVIDPGVGTPRKPVAVQGKHGFFVGPDNGLLCGALQAQGCLDVKSGKLVEGIAVELSDPRYRRERVSNTFHGRDIFAPAAAYLARGVPIAELGRPVTALQCRPVRPPGVRRGMVHGTFIHLDRFGNAISNVPASMLPASPVFEVSGRVIEGLSTSYQDAPIVALEGSTGLVEIAARNGSAADMLGLRPGDILLVRSAAGKPPAVQ